MKWLALLCVLLGSAAAGQHAMHYTYVETIHVANQGGAINRNNDARVEWSRLPGDQMIVTDRGTFKEHNLYQDHASDDVKTWSNVWTGTYKLSGDSIRADLTLKDRKCSKTKSYSDAAGQTTTCDPVDKKIELRCAFNEVALATPSGPPKSEMLWSCWTSAKLDGTPLPWVFGGDPPCVELAPSHSGEPVYHRCP